MYKLCLQIFEGHARSISAAYTQVSIRLNQSTWSIHIVKTWLNQSLWSKHIPRVWLNQSACSEQNLNTYLVLRLLSSADLEKKGTWVCFFLKATFRMFKNQFFFFKEMRPLPALISTLFLSELTPTHIYMGWMVYVPLYIQFD